MISNTTNFETTKHNNVVQQTGVMPTSILSASSVTKAASSKKSFFAIPPLPTPLAIKKRLAMRASLIRSPTTMKKEEDLDSALDQTNEEASSSLIAFASPTASPPRMSSGGLTLRDIQYLTSTKKKKNAQLLPSFLEGDLNISNIALSGIKKRLDESAHYTPSSAINSSKQHDDALNAILTILNNEEMLLNSLGTAITSSSSYSINCNTNEDNSTSSYHKSNMKRKVEADVALMMENATREQLATLPDHYKQGEGVNLKHMALYWRARSRFEACHNKIHCAIDCLNEGKNTIWCGAQDGAIDRSVGLKEIDSLDMDIKRLEIRISDTMKIEPDQETNIHRKMLGRENDNTPLENRSGNKVLADLNLHSMIIESDQTVDDDTELNMGVVNINFSGMKLKDMSHDAMGADKILPSTQHHTSNNLLSTRIDSDKEIARGIANLSHSGRKLYTTGENRNELEYRSHDNSTSTASSNLGSIVEMIASKNLTPVRRSARIRDTKSKSSQKKFNRKENQNPNPR